MPKLSELGAYSKFNHVYSQAVIKDLIEFARYRGVRIIPEFDTPGHTESWGPGAGDGFLTKCCDSKGVPDGTVGPIDPSVQANYDLMKTLFGEVKELFKDEFIHLGGDEVPFSCWQSNPNITKARLHRPRLLLVCPRVILSPLLRRHRFCETIPVRLWTIELNLIKQSKVDEREKSYNLYRRRIRLD